MNNKKIAIKVENEREFKALMKYYHGVKKWLSYLRLGPTGVDYIVQNEGCITYVDFTDRFQYTTQKTPPERLFICNKEYIIIPFAHLAAIEGIEVEPDEIIIEKESLVIHVKPNYVEIKYRWDTSPCQTRGLCVKHNIIEEIYTALKSFEK